jgi:hypothetical protein
LMHKPCNGHRSVPSPRFCGEREQTEIVARLIPFRRNGLV